MTPTEAMEARITGRVDRLEARIAAVEAGMHSVSLSLAHLTDLLRAEIAANRARTRDAA